MLHAGVDRVVADSTAMCAAWAGGEGGGGAALSGVTMRPLDGVNGVFTADQLIETLGRAHPFNPSTLLSPPTLLCIENTHNGAGGTIWPLDELRNVCETGRAHGMTLHLDGARLWHASASSGVDVSVYAEPFDTVNVCFSKGLQVVVAVVV